MKSSMRNHVTKLVAIAIGIGMLAGCEGGYTSSTPASNQVIVPTEIATTPKPVSSGTTSDKAKEQEIPASAVVQDVGAESGKPKEETTGKEPEKKSKLQPIYSVEKGTVAITIDDGPTKYTGELLKMLRENNTKVTFFFLGQNAVAYPQAVTEAVYEGHEIGYHSNSHPKMSSMTFDQQEKEFGLGLSNLEKFDHEQVTLFRPPYGAYNNDTKLVTEEHNMKMVLWNEDPRDWSTTDASAVAKGVLAQVHSGSIIVLHDRPSTIAALPTIIEGIKKKGLKIVQI